MSTTTVSTSTYYTHEGDNNSNNNGSPILFFLLGWIFLFISVQLIWKVEKQAVKFMLIVQRCQMATRPADPNFISPSLENRSICVSSDTRVEPPLVANSDPDTGFVAVDDSKASSAGVNVSTTRNIIRLRRTVEMWQWIEIQHEHKDNNTTTTTYEYTQGWRECDINSSNFHYLHRDAHVNPPRFPALYSETKNSPHVMLGRYYRLNPQQIEKLYSFQSQSISNDFIPKHGGRVEQGPQMSFASNESNAGVGKSYLVYNGSLLNPSVGTVRICYDVVRDGGPVTVVGVQVNDTFRPFTEDDAHAHKPSCIVTLARKLGLGTSWGGT